jgi:hypothetical protein
MNQVKFVILNHSLFSNLATELKVLFWFQTLDPPRGAPGGGSGQSTAEIEQITQV